MIKLKIKNIDQEFNRINKEAAKLTQEQSRKISKQLLNELVEKTPIDTGLARASWKLKENRNVFEITNSTEYIQYLNEGSSKQAPAFFIESTALKYGKPLGTIVQKIGD